MVNIVNVGYDSTNYYVLANPTPVLLIDVGFPETLPKLEHVTRRMGIDLRAIPYVLCTHYHPDHAGAAGDLQRLGLNLIVMEPQLPFVEGARSFVKPDLQFVPVRMADAMHLTIGESRAFLQRLGLDGTIVHTPGHSDDSVSLVLADGAAFVGDFPPLYVAGDAPDDPVRRGWDALLAAGAQTIYAGHGPVVGAGPGSRQSAGTGSRQSAVGRRQERGVGRDGE